MVSVETLVSYASELEDDATGTGLAWLQARRGEALAKINGGGTSDIITTTVNGETYTRRIVASADEWLDAIQSAIDEFNGRRVRTTYARINCAPL